MSTVKHAIQNFQIPVTNFDRALSFYNTLMGYELESMEFEGVKLAVFRHDNDTGVGGTLIKDPGMKPSKSGTRIYLNCGEDLAPNLERAKERNADIIKEKTSLGPDMGFFAIIEDTEGNHIGLFSKT